MSIETSNPPSDGATTSGVRKAARPNRPDPNRSTEPDRSLAETRSMSSPIDDHHVDAAETIWLQSDSEADPSIPVSVDRVIAGRYCLERELGRGGFGVVMLAYDRDLQRQVAIKIARRTSGRGVDELLEEGRKVAQLDHPRIVPVYDCGRINSRTVYIVSKYVDGGSLASRLSLRRLSIDEAISIAMQVAEGLAHAHDLGLIHRDLKPSNILLDVRDNAYVADFGLALRASDRSDRVCVEGSLQYMSPEQAAGKSRLVDRRTDVFSFGVILFEMLTGKKLFPGRSAVEYRDQVIQQEPPPPSHLCPEVPPRVDQLCQKALAKLPSERFASGWELAEELRQCQKTAPAPRCWKRIALAIAGTLAAVLLLVAMLLLLASWLAPLWRPEQPGSTPPPVVADPRSSAISETIGMILDRGGAVDFERYPARIYASDQLPDEPLHFVAAVNLLDALELTGAEVEAICALPGLRYLQLGNSGLIDRDIEAIARKLSLGMLWLGYNDLSDRGLAKLGALGKLWHLDLEKTALGDAGLAAISGCRELQFLNVSDTEITDRGLAPLRGLPVLRELWLNRTSLTDAAVDDLLALQGLRKLELKEVDLSPEAVARLREGLPDCEIVR